MSVPDMEADENGVGLAHRILHGGASETRSWHVGAASPIRKLILVRPRTDDGRPSPGGEHAGETGVSPRTARWLPASGA